MITINPGKIYKNKTTTTIKLPKILEREQKESDYGGELTPKEYGTKGISHSFTALSLMRGCNQHCAGCLQLKRQSTDFRTKEVEYKV